MKLALSHLNLRSGYLTNNFRGIAHTYIPNYERERVQKQGYISRVRTQDDHKQRRAEYLLESRWPPLPLFCSSACPALLRRSRPIEQFSDFLRSLSARLPVAQYLLIITCISLFKPYIAALFCLCFLI